ncbi:hypothetical protein EWB00_002788 [Schistosoma japonicum]|uniref:Uncharacterized protein n=1 Tax=Schistosoma japonicum TaxID=6182 RepID=A0A4Z2DAT4_SCHJA|nr:hypothetical protein EWB00_002788 [Schistosoma japonicum]
MSLLQLAGYRKISEAPTFTLRRDQGSSVEVTEGDYHADSDSSNVGALKNPIDNNLYSETDYRQDQLFSEENRNNGFHNNDNTKSSNNGNYYTFLPSNVQNLNAYLNSLGNQEITPLISRSQIQ